MVCEEACSVGDEKSEIGTTPGVAPWVGKSVDRLEVELNLMAEAGWEDVGRLPSRVLLRDRLDVVQIDVGVVKVEAFPVLQATGSMVKIVSSRRADVQASSDTGLCVVVRVLAFIPLLLLNLLSLPLHTLLQRQNVSNPDQSLLTPTFRLRSQTDVNLPSGLALQLRRRVALGDDRKRPEDVRQVRPERRVEIPTGKGGEDRLGRLGGERAVGGRRRGEVGLRSSVVDCRNGHDWSEEKANVDTSVRVVLRTVENLVVRTDNLDASEEVGNDSVLFPIPRPEQPKFAVNSLSTHKVDVRLLPSLSLLGAKSRSSRLRLGGFGLDAQGDRF